MERRAQVYHRALRALRHDARNIQAGISVLNDRLESSDDERSRRFAEILVDRVTSLVVMTERIEQLASIEPAPRTMHPVRDITDKVIATRETDPTRLFFAAGDHLPLPADAALATKAMDELVDNALQAQPQGAITLNVRVDDGSGETVVTIADQGPGIPKTARDHLFTPFKGAKREGSSGLGIPIADAAMQAQGGSLTIMDGEGGLGTLAMMTFPPL